MSTRHKCGELSHLKKAHHYEICDFLQMDFATKASLDLTEMRGLGKHGSYWYIWMKPRRPWWSFVAVLDSKPLVDLERFRERQDIIQVFMDHFFERSDLTDSLKGSMTLNA